MVFGWLKPKKRTKKEEMEREHPFDKAAREVNDELARLKMTTEQIEEEEARREAMAALKRLRV